MTVKKVKVGIATKTVHAKMTKMSIAAYQISRRQKLSEYPANISAEH